MHTGTHPPAEPTDRMELQNELEENAEGLLYISETESPFEYVELSLPAGEELTADSVRSALEVPEDEPILELSLHDFLAPHIEQADPADPVAQENIERFRALKQLLCERLTGVRVFRVGEVQVCYYLLGETAKGTVAGLMTQALET